MAGEGEVDGAGPTEDTEGKFTALETDLQQYTLGPSHGWREDHGRSDAPGMPRDMPDDLPPVAKERLRLFREICKTPEAKVLTKAPARLRSYCHARLLEGRMANQTLTLEEVLQDAVELGDAELGEQAKPYLLQRMERVGGQLKTPEVYVTKVKWSKASDPGWARAHIIGRVWDVLDYRDQLEATSEMADCLPGLKCGQLEERQGAFKVMIINFIERYFYLIVFAMYIRELGPKGFPQTFKQYMDDHSGTCLNV